MLRKVQVYSVSLYENDFEQLYTHGAIELVGESGILVLKDAFYFTRA